jgi:DNA-binding GntR family transcriptional regulator
MTFDPPPSIPTQTPAAAAASSPDAVVEAIFRGIAAGRYVPGQRLIEADLTRQLKLSRGPVREAFKRLAGEGVLTLSRHRGACIRAYARDEVGDVLAVTEVLWALASKRAAERIGESGNRHGIEVAYQQLLDCRDASESHLYQSARNHFYDALIDASGNQEIARAMPRVQLVLLQAQLQGFIPKERRVDQIEEFTAVAEAVLQGNAMRAHKAMANHIRRRREALMSLPDEAYAVDPD